MQDVPQRTIRSGRNERFKTWLKYVRNPETDTHPWLPVEGLKHIADLAEARPIELLLTSGRDRVPEALMRKSAEVVSITDSLMSRLSSVRQHQGLIAFFKKPVWQWNNASHFIIYLNQWQDPGNLGTVLRTAWATRQFTVVTSPGTVSLFNSKVIRASAAMLFRVPFLQGVRFGDLRRRGYRVVATAASEGTSLFEISIQPPVAFVLGSEGGGINESILTEADMRVHIPMQPECDSLNAGVAGALVVYEVYRRFP